MKEFGKAVWKGVKWVAEVATCMMATGYMATATCIGVVATVAAFNNNPFESDENDGEE